jgi:PAS fold
VLSKIIAGVLTVPDVGSVVSFLSQELEKLIAFSGTPTVVWRRTGEICLVAPEFITLTEWSREELLGRRKYIYEVRS